MKKIMVCHDGSKLSDKALKKAVELAVALDSQIIVLSVIPDMYLTELSDMDRQRISDALSEETHAALEKVRAMLASQSINSKTIVRQGAAAEIIIETAKKSKVGLVVVGSHGRHGAKKFLLGSVSSKVVDYAACPVLVVK